MSISIRKIKFMKIEFSKLTFLVSFILILSNISLKAETDFPREIEITSSTTLREMPYFAGDSYLSGILNSGDRVRIIALNQNHSSGVSFQVEVLEGEQRGKTGWIYFHKATENRTMVLLDKEGQKVEVPGVVEPGSTETEKANAQNLPEVIDTTPIAGPSQIERARNEQQQSSGFMSEFGFNGFFKDFSDEMLPTKSKGFFTSADVPEHYTRIKPDQEIWNGALDGEYQIQLDDYDGGEFIPFVKERVNSYGVKTQTRYYARNRPEYLAMMPDQIQRYIEQKGNELKGNGCRGSHRQINDVGDERLAEDWLPHCEVLAQERIGSQHISGLGQCLDSIKEEVTRGMDMSNLNRGDVFRNLYEKLNPKEEEFIAMILSSIGEAGVLAPPLEEMVGIMKVLENRKKYARQRGFDNANELDAALQGWQFSMYNEGAHHWSTAIRQTTASPQTINALQAYVLHQNVSYAEEDVMNEVYHYHTNYVDPDWKDNSKVVRMDINGQTLKQSGKRHIFYKNIPWTFRHNEWSGK